MNRTVRVAAEATLALLITASSLWAQDALPRGVVRVASVEGITEYRLENGLRTLIMPDPSKGIITVNIVYQVGSRHEDYGETGMAHLIEHLMSIGSTRHSDAKREQSERGAQRNASTWFDRTNYYEIFPSSPDNLTWALDLEADRMVNASITRDLLNSQMSVVRNEFEIGENNPARVLEERVFSTAFLWHNYGKSTIGARTDIERVPIERLQAFYRKYYRPDNAVLIVAGRLDERTAIDVVAAKFGGIRAPEQPVPLTYTEEPVQDGERSVMLRRVGDLQHLTMAFHIPAAAHADVAAMELLTDALTAAPAGRLHKALVEKTLATEVSGNVHTLREAGLVVLNVNVRKDVPLDRVRDAMLAELARLSTDGLSSDEVERSRARLLKTIDLAMAESDREASLLVEWIAAGDWRLMFLDRDRLRRVTVDEVRAVASNYLKASNRTIGQFIPEDAPSRSEIPASPSLTELVRDYKGDPIASMGEPFDPQPDAIERRAERRTLSSGMQVIVVPRKTRGSAVAAALRFDYGDERSLQGLTATSDAVRQMLTRGTARRSRQQIEDELTRLKADLQVTGTIGRTQVMARTVAANLPAVLSLIAEIVREPAFRQNDFDEMRQAALADAESLRGDPAQLSRNAVLRQLNPFTPGDPRALPTPDEQIAALSALTLERLKDFHRRFYTMTNASLAVSGDASVAQIAEAASTLFTGWPSGAPHAKLVRPYTATAARTGRIDTPDKTNAAVTAGLLFPVADDHPDYPAIVLANYMLGGHAKSRLYDRIRGREGLSYSVGSQLMTTPGEAQITWIFNALTNPVNAGKVEASFRDELTKVLENGFTAQEIEAAKQGYMQSRQVQRSSDAALVQRLTVLAADKRTMAFDGTLEQRILALSSDQISQVVRRHLDVSRVVLFRAGDFSKAQ